MIFKLASLTQFISPAQYIRSDVRIEYPLEDDAVETLPLEFKNPYVYEP